MNHAIKNQKEILDKLGISQLNPMQVEAFNTIMDSDEVVLLSPTGTGKTLAFLLPLLQIIKTDIQETQAIILVPSRELAIQIEQVMRDMGSGYKVNAVYGGRSSSSDRLLLSTAPVVLIGTPGRIADHLRRGTVKIKHITTLILDEFDKSLETGFEKEMKEIAQSLSQVDKKILTSATEKVSIPHFMEMKKPVQLNFLKKDNALLALKYILSDAGSKLNTLQSLLLDLSKQRGIIFCNYKETIVVVSDFLSTVGIDHSLFYGGLEQVDRERALIKFRNGSHHILLATDLAARGIDVPALDYIVHYQLPSRPDEFIHRNGRTARMQASGAAFMIVETKEHLPDFIPSAAEYGVKSATSNPIFPVWETLYISGGRKDKISKGDIAGLFFKQGMLQKEELGLIELKNDCAFIAVPYNKAQSLATTLNNSKIKKRKVRISILKT